jgi:site-specific recombinase XerD|tara:strand:+ start:2910 stop:4145 length:1236 start_codon:yes stop_codon:yes gene_type:complete
MEKQTLTTLLVELEQELLRLGYTPGSMKFYRREWKKLQLFAAEKGERHYSEKLGMEFIEAHYKINDGPQDREMKRSEVYKFRVIRMIGDFQLHHTILRRYYKHKEILTQPFFIDVLSQFHQFCKRRDYSDVTIEHYTKQSARFMDFLSSRGIESFEPLSLETINDYIKTLAGYTYKTVEQNICSLRRFFYFLHETEYVKVDYSSKLPMVQARKQTRIPSVWSNDELQRLIAAIDRGSPKGKRDHAIILLACHLGLRVTDVKNLTMENFHWAEKKLVFVQSKTKQNLSLPLTPEVGWAVIDYLRYGRPQIESPYVFVRHMAPYGPFAKGNHLGQLIGSYMERAHLPKLKKKRGMHSLRHTLASMLLEHDTPLALISDILGHTDTDSTAVYLKVDIKKLRECALDIERSDIDE